MTDAGPGNGAAGPGANATGPVPDAAEAPVCSAKGCRREASHLVVWRNPKIHSADRRKTWPACADHVDHLSDFLRARSFPVEVVTVPPGGGPG